MAAVAPAKVTEVTHWNDRLFSFKTERSPEFRFENGHFTMIGLLAKLGLCSHREFRRPDLPIG